MARFRLNIYIFASTFTLALSGIFGCQHLDEEATKQQEILNTQMGIIINYLNTGKPVKAHKELRPLLKEHPDNAELQNLMGLTYLAFKKPRMAEKYLRNAFKIKPTPAFGLNLGSSLIEQRRYKQAVKLLKGFKKEGIEEYEFPERFDHNIALAYERARKPKQAIRYYKSALRLNPNNYVTIMQLAKLYEKLKRPKSASRYFELARRTCLRCYEPVRFIALHHARAGNIKKAIATLESYKSVQKVHQKDLQAANELISKVSGLGSTPKENHR